MVHVGIAHLAHGAPAIEKRGKEVILGGQAEVLERDGVLDDVVGAPLVELLDDDQVRAQGRYYDAGAVRGRRGDGSHGRRSVRGSRLDGLPKVSLAAHAGLDIVLRIIQQELDAEEIAGRVDARIDE